MARFFRFALAAILTAGVGLVVALSSYRLGLWAGGSRYRLEQVLWLGVLLPIFVGLLAALWPMRKLNRSALVASTAGAAVGLVYGYLAVRVDIIKSFHSLVRYVFLNTFWGIDIEIMLCGAVAGACAMLLTTTSRTRKVLFAVAILVVVGILIPGPIFHLITHKQELTVAIVTPQGQGPQSPEVTELGAVRPVDVSAMSGRVMRLLRDDGIGGNYQVAQLYRQGQGKQALAIIVIGGLIAEAADLPEPHGADVIYLQEAGGWKRIPPDVPALNRGIYIYPDQDGRSCHLIKFTDASGLGTTILVGNATQCGSS